jgi:hypothetical protein
MNDNEPLGKADPKEWADGGTQDLRDPRGGTYGGITTAGASERIIPAQNMQPGSEERIEPLVNSDELPEGLKHERKGPMNKTTGRRPAKD